MGAPSVLMVSREGHPIPPLASSTAEGWIDAVARGLSGYVPHVVSAPHPALPDSQLVGGVRYHRIRVGALYNRLFRKLTRLDPYSYVERVIAYAEAVQPEIIHVHDAAEFVPRLRAVVVGARLVLHMHEDRAVPRLPRVDALCGCSRYVTDRYRGRGVEADRYAELPSGVDVARFRPGRDDARAAARRRFDVPADRFVVLYVGRIAPEKGPDLLVEAVRRLDPARFHLVLAGEWPHGDPQRSAPVVFAESLRARLGGMPASVLGHYAPEAMPEIYRLGDLLVVPSRIEEPFSMVAIEAMAAGLPVLALARGGMKEHMIDGESALVVSAEADAAEIAAAVGSAAGSPGRLARIAGEARAMVEARYTWTNVVRQTERLYREMLQ